MSQPADDDRLSPQESMRVIADQQTRVNQRLGADPLVFWGPWGAAWLIGFGLFFLHYGLDGAPYVAMPQSLPLIVLFSLMFLAMVATMGVGIRSTRHIRGASNIQGMMFGMSWFFGFLTVVSVGSHFGEMLPVDERGLLWAGMAVGVTGMLYMAGAAIFSDWNMFGMGLWITVVNAVGVSAGPGWHALLASVGGGGGMLLAGVLLRFKSRSNA